MFANWKPTALAILRPITGMLIRSGIHPNALTAVGLLLSCVAGVLFAIGPLAWAATFVLLAGLFDIFDGAVAREGRCVSRYGAFLDSSIDRYGEIALFLGILWRFQHDTWTQVAAMVAVAGSLMVSYTKARAEGLGEEVHGGLLQRPERIVILALGSYFGEGALRIVVWILALFTNLTSVQRMVLVADSMRTSVRSEGEDDQDGVSVDSPDIGTAPPAV